MFLFPSSGPFEHLQLYVIQQPLSMKYQYVLVTVCMFSRWTEVFPCHRADALTAAKKLFNAFSTWVIPSMISSDGGTHFVGSTIQALTQNLANVLELPLSYHPQSSGKVGRTNEILKLKISKLAETSRLPWVRYHL